MIAFGCAVTARTTYQRYAEPGVERAREADSIVLAPDNPGTLSHGYNAILDELAARDGVEAAVLLHQDLEITSSEFPAAVRAALHDRDVAVVGAAGSPRVSSLSWWEPGPVVGAYEWIFSSDGGGRVDMGTWNDFVSADRVEEVEAVDGMILVFSSWAIENLRFDTELDPSAHGYDVDICFQARAAGRKVVVAPLGVSHHHELIVMSDAADWITAHKRFAEKWEGRPPGPSPGSDWKQRARDAEAELEAVKVARNELSLLRNEADRRAIDAYARAGEIGRVAQRDHRQPQLEGVGAIPSGRRSASALVAGAEF